MNKKISKHAVICLYFLLCLQNSILVSETGNKAIDFLFYAADASNKDIKSAFIDMQNAEQNLDAYALNYPMILSFTNQNIFTNMQSDSVYAPLEASASFSISQPLPKELNISLTGKISIDKQDTSLNYADSVLLSLELQKYLVFFPRELRIISPLKTTLQNNLQSSLLQLATIRENTRLQLLNLYVNIRQLSRTIEAMNLSLEVEQKKLKYLNDEYLRGTVSLSEVFAAEDSLYTAENSLNNYKNSLAVVLTDLETLLNRTLTEDEINILCDTSEPLPEQIQWELKADSELYLLSLQKENLILNLYENRIKTAPSISISASVEGLATPYTIDSPFSFFRIRDDILWSLNIGISFSPMLWSINKSQETKFRVSNEFIIFQTEARKNALNRALEYYQRNILQLQTEAESLCQAYTRRFQFYQSVLELKQSGMCSELDALKAESTVKTSETNLNNIQDAIWYAQQIKSTIHLD